MIVMPPEYYEMVYRAIILGIIFGLGVMCLMIYFDFETWLSNKLNKEE
jgi:hypothetical protein